MRWTRHVTAPTDRVSEKVQFSGDDEKVDKREVKGAIGGENISPIDEKAEYVVHAGFNPAPPVICHHTGQGSATQPVLPVQGRPRLEQDLDEWRVQRAACEMQHTRWNTTALAPHNSLPFPVRDAFEQFYRKQLVHARFIVVPEIEMLDRVRSFQKTSEASSCSL